MNTASQQIPASAGEGGGRGPMQQALPLFLIGAPRSGTTVLSHILNAHPRILLTNESATVIQLGEMIRRSRIGVSEGVMFGKTHNDIWADLLLENVRELTERFYSNVAQAEGKAVPCGTDGLAYFGDKHPHLKDCSDILGRVFPEARYIHMVRDPRDSALSIAEMSGHSFYESMLNWKMFDDKYTEFLGSVGDESVCRVQYESLVSDYEGCASRIFQWLGLDHDPGVSDFISKYSNTDAHRVGRLMMKAEPDLVEVGVTDLVKTDQYLSQSVGRWRRELNDDDKALADGVVGGALARYGYDRWSTAIPEPVQAAVHEERNTSETSSEMIRFQCNICGTQNEVTPDMIGRETSSCSGCRSTVRMRSIIHLLSTEIFGKSMVISDMPLRPDLVGLGMSDWSVYAKRLAKVFRYTNTFYDCKPSLDITDPDPGLLGMQDFIVSSDVFEHVAPPVSIAFENAKKLLKPGGVLIFSVPFSLADTVEHFPDLFDYEIVGSGEQSVLKNTTRAGVRQEFRDLVFHGGQGATLEMRVFGKEQLIEQLVEAGFEEPMIYDQPHDEFGIHFPQAWSLPIVARVPHL